MLSHSSKTTCGQVAALALSVLLSLGVQAQTATPNIGVIGTAATAATPTSDAVLPAPVSARLGTQQQQATAADPANKTGLDANTPEAQRVQPPLRASEPSQFQRFVQDSTGRLLPM